jgi:hypothetical protein
VSNWSPGIINSFRELRRFGQSLDTILSQQRADRDEPARDRRRNGTHVTANRRRGRSPHGIPADNADFVAALAARGDLVAASIDDREWFARHFGRNHRSRRPIGGERPLVSAPPGFKAMVVVRQLESGSRGRIPFAWHRGEPLLNSEATAKQLFWQASRAQSFPSEPCHEQAGDAVARDRPE